MRFDIITIFPNMFGSVFSVGVIQKAIRKGAVEIYVHDLRDYTTDKHKQVDDKPFGGGQGMVLKAEPIFAAVEDIRSCKDAPVYLLSPQGERFNHKKAKELSEYNQIILICGRYEGIDERVVQCLATQELSIGDYVLTGGEMAAAVMIDAISRFVPGVVGKEESVIQDSFYEGLFDHPHYTRPRNFRGMEVPEVLLSGDHREIEDWRRKKRLEKTRKVRPDILNRIQLSPEDKDLLEKGMLDKERKSK